MAWQFTGGPAPTFVSGVSLLEVPLTEDAVPNGDAIQLWVLGIWVVNNTAVERTFTLVDAAGVVVLPAAVRIPAHGWIMPEPPFLPILGLRWAADGAGVWSMIWGYK